MTNGLAFLTFPLLARHLSVGDYGAYDLYATISVLLSVIITFGIDSSVGRFFHEYEDLRDKKELLSQAFFLQIGAIIIVSLILFIFSASINQLFNQSSNTIFLYRLVLYQIPFIVLLNFSLNLLKWSFAKWQFIILTGFSSALNLAFLSALIYGYKIDLANVFKAILIAKILAAFLGLFLISKWIHVPKNSKYIGAIVKYAFPIGLVCIIDVSVPAVERTIVGKMISIEALGQYAAASKAVLIITLFAQAFQSAWGPFSLSIHKQELSGKTYALVAKVFVLFMCSAALLITAFGRMILEFFAGERYSNAYIIIFPLTMSFVVQSTSWITEIGIGISKKTKLNFYSHTLHLITSVMLISFFTSYYGIIGTACGVLFSHIIRAVIISILSQKAYYIKWPFMVITLIIGLTLILGLLWIAVIDRDNILIDATFVTMSILCMALGFWHLALEPSEREPVAVFYSSLYK